MKTQNILVGGQKWQIRFVSPRNKNLKNPNGGWFLGRCFYDRCKLYVAKAPPTVMEDTLLHEFLHCVLFTSGGEAAYGADPEKEELLVTAVTPLLHRLLTDFGVKFPGLTT